MAICMRTSIGRCKSGEPSQRGAWHRGTGTLCRVCMYWYMYMCIHLSLYIHVSIFLNKYTYIYIYIFVCICIYVYMYVYRCIFVYVYVHIYIYIYICIFIYLFRHVYSHRDTSGFRIFLFTYFDAYSAPFYARRPALPMQHPTLSA